MIYFDNAATTQPTITPQIYHNPSSPHALGIKSERALRDARVKIASALCASGNLPSALTHASLPAHIPVPEEIIFTSGGTESNNLAILGYALANKKNGISLTSATYEHPSILAPVRFAQEYGWATQCVQNKAHLFSVSHVNHETGDINDIAAISAEIKKNNPSSVIHVDGAQGFGKENICLHLIDMYSFSGHKCHGPTGTGGLWIKKGIRLTPLLHGGGQENNRRSGTENVSAIVQMAEAAKLLSQNKQANHVHVAKLKSILESLQDALPDVCVNSLSRTVSPYILNLSFLGVKGEILVHALSEKGLLVSMGAACNSRKRAKSALEIMGFDIEIAQSAVRFSFSPYNTIAEAGQAHDIVIDTVKRLRNVMRK